MSDIKEIENFTNDMFICGICLFQMNSIEEYVKHMLVAEKCVLVTKLSQISNLFLPKFKINGSVKFKGENIDEKAQVVEVGNGKKRIKCNICCLTFSRYSALLNHFKLTQHFFPSLTKKEPIYEKNVKSECLDFKSTQKTENLSKIKTTKNVELDPNSAYHDLDNNLKNVKEEKFKDYVNYSSNCPICHQQFKSEAVVSAHMKNFHLDHEKIVESEKFQTSDNDFKEIAALNTRDFSSKSLKINDKRFKNLFNSENFEDQVGFETLEKNSKYFEDKEFSFDKEKEHTCPICHQIFKSHQIVIGHLKIVHSPSRPFICEYENCSSSFKTKGALVRHIRVHEDIKPFKCLKCGKCFRECGYLLQHQQSKFPCLKKLNKDKLRIRNQEQAKVTNLSTKSEFKKFSKKKCNAITKATDSNSFVEIESSDLSQLENTLLNSANDCDIIKVSEPQNFKNTLNNVSGNDFSNLSEKTVPKLKKERVETEVNIGENRSEKDFEIATKDLLESKKCVNENLKIETKGKENYKELIDNRDLNISSSTAVIESISNEDSKYSSVKRIINKELPSSSFKIGSDNLILPASFADSIPTSTFFDHSNLPNFAKTDTSIPSKSNQSVIRIKKEFSMNLKKETLVSNFDSKREIKSLIETSEDKKDINLNSIENMKIFRTSFVCPLCCKTFSKGSLLSSHLNTHIEDLDKECSICKKQFSSKQSLFRHFTSHSTVRQYECKECSKTFKLKPHALAHLKSHSAIKSFPCLVCNRFFKTMSSRNVHIKIHNGEKNFECSYCRKRFIAKASLERHIRVHTNERPYSCSTCLSNFKDHGALSRHVKKYCLQNMQKPAKKFDKTVKNNGTKKKTLTQRSKNGKTKSNLTKSEIKNVKNTKSLNILNESLLKLNEEKAKNTNPNIFSDIENDPVPSTLKYTQNNCTSSKVSNELISTTFPSETNVASLSTLNETISILGASVSSPTKSATPILQIDDSKISENLSSIISSPTNSLTDSVLNIESDWGSLDYDNSSIAGFVNHSRGGLSDRLSSVSDFTDYSELSFSPDEIWIPPNLDNPFASTPKTDS